MPTPESFIAAARREVGVTESPPGSNRQPYAAAAGHANGQAWCATFVVAMARSVGMKVGNESAYTPALYASMRHGPDPQLGALSFFNFPNDGVNRIQHVGIVVGWTDTTVISVEGNTSAGSYGSQSNGGGVYVRSRPRIHVVGYGYPPFDITPYEPQEEDDDMFSDQDRRQLEELRAHVMSVEAQLPVVTAGHGSLFANGAWHWGFTTSDGRLQRWVWRTDKAAWVCDIDEPGFEPGQWGILTSSLPQSPYGQSFETSARLADGKVGRIVWTPSEGFRPVEIVGA